MGTHLFGKERNGSGLPAAPAVLGDLPVSGGLQEEELH